MIVLSEQCPALIALCLEACKNVTMISVTALVQHCKNMETLNLAGSGVDICSALLLMAQTADYECLVFERCRAGTEAVVDHLPYDIHRSHSSGRNMLRCLSYQSNSRDVRNVEELLQHCPHLKQVVWLNHTHIEDSCLSALVAHCPSLDSFSCNNFDHISPLSVACVISAYSRRLTTLHLDNCKAMTDEIFVNAITGCALLRDLSLENCVLLSDAALTKIATTCRLITSLDIRKCTLITDRGLKQIILQYNRGLRQLYINGCRGLTAKIIHELCQHCTELVGLHMRGCNIDPADEPECVMRLIAACSETLTDVFYGADDHYCSVR